MDIKTQLEQLAKRVELIKPNIKTEEATKTAFVLPFIQALGYDIFNPMEVIPEFVADVGIKKGEKVDYAILRDNIPIIIIECKHWNEDLYNHDSQLHRYFHVTNARFAILTNGIVYRFFSDLDHKNVMDSSPFFEFNLCDIRETSINEVTKFQKSSFDVDNIIDSASGLKYLTALKAALQKQMNEPSLEFVKILTSYVYTGRVTEKVQVLFTDIIRKAFQQTVSDLVNDRLKSALVKEHDQQQIETVKEEVNESKIITSQEEIEGFHIVKALVRHIIDPSRVVYRDTQSYMGILLDDNNRKPICRLWFNSATKYIGVMGAEKFETRHPINTLNDLYGFSDEIIAQVQRYLEEENSLV